MAFVAAAVLLGVFSVRSAYRGWPALERTFESSSQLAVRLAVVLIFGLVALASQLGLDLLLGGFVAGMITRVALRGHELAIFESKLNAVGYGFLIPFFFVTSGMAFNLDVLVNDPTALLKLPLFAVLFLVVRGVPALALYRDKFDLRDRAALGVLCATELPLVVAITTLALSLNEMRPSTASALVGAAIISTLVYPLIGLRLRRDRIVPDESWPRRARARHNFAPGRLAQLGERLPYKQEVGGSSPPPPIGLMSNRGVSLRARREA